MSGTTGSCRVASVWFCLIASRVDADRCIPSPGKKIAVPNTLSVPRAGSAPSGSNTKSLPSCRGLVRSSGTRKSVNGSHLVTILVTEWLP